MRLWLNVIGYNLGNLRRRLVLPKQIGNWSLTSFQQQLVKAGEQVETVGRFAEKAECAKKAAV